MAYSTSAVDSGEVSAQVDGKPCFLMTNLQDYTEVRWVHGTSWGTNEASADNPLTNLHDYRPIDPSIPNDYGSTSDYSIIANYAGALYFNCVAVQMTADMEGTSMSVIVDIADDSGGSPGSWTSIASNVVTSGEKRFGWLLANNYQAVDWIRFRFTNQDEPPRVGQVWIGTRIQLGTKARRPHDIQRTTSKSTRFEPYGRAIRKYVHAKGMIDPILKFQAVNQDDGYGINNYSKLKSVWSLSEEGTQPVLYWEDASAVAGYVCEEILNKPEFELTGPFVADRLEFVMQELPPFSNEE